MHRRWRRGMATVVLLLAPAGVAACHGGGNGARPAVGASATASATATASTCVPKVTSAGYFHRTGSTNVYYGLMLDNPCDQASIGNVLRVVLVDAAGNELTKEADNDYGSALPVILPHQQLASTGLIGTQADVDKATGIKAEVTRNQLVSPSLFAKWPTTVTVQNVTFGPTDQAGTTDLRFDVMTAPAGAQLCNPFAHVLIRDKGGKILYGTFDHADLPFVEMQVVLPPGADKSQTIITIDQGDC